MARYRKVEVKTWGDDKFRRLSPILPCGQGLWVWLLTGPRTTNIPGIVLGTDLVMAAELRWPLEGFREAFAEAFREGMVKACWEAGLVWLPNAAKVGEKRNKPESPNVVRSWADTWDEIPECALKFEVWQHLKAFTEAFGEGFAEAFGEACAPPSVKAMPNQEQNQEQEQNQKERGRGAPPHEPEKGREGNAPAATKGDGSPPAGVIEAGSNLTRSSEEWTAVPGIDQPGMRRWLGHLATSHRWNPTPEQAVIHARELVGQGNALAQTEVVEFSIGRNAKSLIPLVDVRARRNGLHRSSADESKDKREQLERDRLQKLKDGRATRGLRAFRDPYPHEKADAYETQLRLAENDLRGQRKAGTP